MIENLDPGTATRAALADEIAWLRLAFADARTQRDEARREINRLRQRLNVANDEIKNLETLAAECSCGTTKATYEGPEPDCPVHGAVRAFNEAMEEITRLREERDAAWDQIDREQHAAMAHAERAIAAEAQRDEARRDLAAATTALGRIRDLCDERQAQEEAFCVGHDHGPLRVYVYTDEIRAVLPAAGDGAGEATTE